MKKLALVLLLFALEVNAQNKVGLEKLEATLDRGPDPMSYIFPGAHSPMRIAPGSFVVPPNMNLYLLESKKNQRKLSAADYYSGKKMVSSPIKAGEYMLYYKIGEGQGPFLLFGVDNTVVAPK